MITNIEWQKLQEEFGISEVNERVASSKSDVLGVPFDEVNIKTLRELYIHDSYPHIYKDKAYQMWEVSVAVIEEYNDFYNNSYLDEIFVNCAEGSVVYETLIKGLMVRRKERAMLPFNYQRAITGSIVEVKTAKGMVTIPKEQSSNFIQYEGNIVGCNNDRYNEMDLYMKYPHLHGK